MDSHRRRKTQMESKATPGPWRVDIDARDGFAIWDGLSRVVASLLFDKKAIDFRPGSPYQSETMEANAYLIASAPQLLEAAKKALTALVYYQHESDIFEKTGTQKALEDAIANAKGKGD